MIWKVNSGEMLLQKTEKLYILLKNSDNEGFKEENKKRKRRQNMKKKKIVSIMGMTVILAFTMGTSVLAAEEFDAAYYAAQNPDVVAAIGNNPAALELHYNTFGIREGRRANSSMTNKGSDIVGLDEFDAAYYAEQNPDVAAIYGTDVLSLYTHYLNFGVAEGRAPSKEAEKKRSMSSKAAENPYARFINTESTGRHHSKHSKSEKESSEEKAPMKKSSLDNLSIYIASWASGERVTIGERFSVRIDGIQLAEGHHYEGLMEEISSNLSDGQPMHDYVLSEPETDWWDIWVSKSAKEGDVLKLKFTCIIKDENGNIVAKKENIEEYIIYAPEDDKVDGKNTSSTEDSTTLTIEGEQEIGTTAKEEIESASEGDTQSDKSEISEIEMDIKTELSDIQEDVEAETVNQEAVEVELL